MRLDQAAMLQITGRSRKSGQARWFQEFLGVEVPCDRQGPILTQSAYESLVAKRVGVFQVTQQQPQSERPSVRLRPAGRG